MVNNDQEEVTVAYRRDLCLDCEYLLRRFSAFSALIQFNNLEYVMPGGMLDALLKANVAFKLRRLRSMKANLRQPIRYRAAIDARAELNDMMAAELVVSQNYILSAYTDYLPVFFT